MINGMGQIPMCHILKMIEGNMGLDRHSSQTCWLGGCGSCEWFPLQEPLELLGEQCEQARCVFSLYFHQESGRKIERESRCAYYPHCIVGETEARALLMGTD